jgi:hypothetical protein
MSHRTRLVRPKQPSRTGDSSRGPLWAFAGVIVTAVAGIAVALIQNPATTGTATWPTVPSTNGDAPAPAASARAGTPPSTAAVTTVPPHDTIGCWQEDGDDEWIDIVNPTVIYNTPWPSGDPTSGHCYPPGYPPQSIQPTWAQIYCWAHGTPKSTTDGSGRSDIWYRLDGANAHYGGYWVNAVDIVNSQHTNPPAGLRRCYP